MVLRKPFSQSVVGEQSFFYPSIVGNILPLQRFYKLTTIIEMTVLTCELMPLTLRVAPSASTV